MQIKTVIVERTTIAYQPHEAKEALEYCSQGKYEIVLMGASRDSRSGRYPGEVIILAWRMPQAA